MAERDEMSPDDAPVTRREFREHRAELEARLATLATKQDIEERFASKDDLKRFATTDDLKRFATKDDLKRFATKDDLAIWAGALEARLGEQLAQMRVDLARHTQAILEAMSTQVSALDDKYKGLPPRVSRLEEIEARRAARRRRSRQS